MQTTYGHDLTNNALVTTAMFHYYQDGHAQHKNIQTYCAEKY